MQSRRRSALKITLLVTVFAVLIGVVLGFLIAIVRTTHDKTGKLKILNAICKVYLTVIRGTPVVVQLMIIYFIIFGSVDISKVVVAIVAFGINSGAYVAEIFRSGIMSIDNGQFEAGRSLGFNYAQTMMYIVMPQAFKNVLPTLCNEFISLLKETSVSGYIALQDLTKGGDIIRSWNTAAPAPALTPGPACSAAAMWKCAPPAQTCTARWITRPGNKPLYHFPPHRQPARCGIFCLQRQYFALLLQYYAPFPLVSPIFICYNNNLLSNLGF